MYNDIEHATLPLAGCTVNVMDISTLRAGCVCAHDRADPRAHSVYDQLTAKVSGPSSLPESRYLLRTVPATLVGRWPCQAPSIVLILIAL